MVQIEVSGCVKLFFNLSSSGCLQLSGISWALSGYGNYIQEGQWFGMLPHCHIGQTSAKMGERDRKDGHQNLHQMDIGKGSEAKQV